MAGSGLGEGSERGRADEPPADERDALIVASFASAVQLVRKRLFLSLTLGAAAAWTDAA